MRFLSTLIALTMIVFGSSCDPKKFSFSVNKSGSANVGFAGVKSITVSPEGRYVLTWDHATGLGDVSALSYEISMDKWSSLPAGVSKNFGVKDPVEGSPLGARFLDMKDIEAPVTKGVLVSSVKGVRSYTLEDALAADTISAFQVRVVGKDGKRDTNKRVLIYSQALNTMTFGGVSGLETTAAGGLLISWSVPTEMGKYSATDITYEVYMESTSESVASVTSGALVINNGMALTDANRIGVLVELSAERLPSTSSPPIADRKGGRSYEITTAPRADLTYIFEVVARGPGGEVGSSKRAIVYRRDSLSFTGLESSKVAVASDQSKITLNWDAATGAQGTVTYIVYSDANFTTAIGSVTATTYEYLNPILGHAYTFAVRAQDGDLLDENHKFVVVTVPDPTDRIPPVFAGVTSADAVSNSKILLKWTASPSTDIAEYRVYPSYNLSQAIATTSGTNYTVTGLTPATSYTFVVRARDATGNEETNNVQRSASTLSYSVPEFAGLNSVTRPGGTDGMTKLTLTWLKGGVTTTGYKIYQSTAGAAIDYNSPTLSIGNANTVTSTITGLTSNTIYSFAVRACDNSSGTEYCEQNTIEKSITTLAITPPTFTGIATAAAGAGSLALSTARVTWPAPATDGVYDGFVVFYEAGTCAAGFSGSPSTSLVAGDTSREATITGLTAQTTYRFRVRSRYSTGDVRDSNTTCQQAYTYPTAPVFAGVTSLARASGTSGFSMANAGWSAAVGSFTYYKVEWATASDFSGATTLPNITTVGTVSKLITGLPVKTLIYVRVSAVFDEGGVLLSSGASQVMSVLTTPVAPVGDGVSSVTVMAADTLKVVWSSPSNIATSVYNGYKLWSYCGASAATNLNAKLSGAADHLYPTSQLDATFTSLTSNVECCYQVRAYFDDGVNTLASGSTVASQCKTPTLTAPTFAGIVGVTNGNDATGFTQLTVNWSAVDVSENGLFSYYEIAWALTPSGQNWSSGTMTVADRATTSKVITGLTENKTYYFRVRAVNANGSPVATNGADTELSALTTPKLPTGDNLATATATGATKIGLSYFAPSGTLSVGGLFNSVFLFVRQGTIGQATSYHDAFGTITSVNITTLMSSAQATLSGDLTGGKLIRVPSSEFTAGAANTYTINGLASNQPVCVYAMAAYWVDGQTTRFLPSTTPSVRCATPASVAPTFGGVTTLTGYDDSRDFTQMTVHWGAITGDCTGVAISIKTTAGTPDFVNSSYKDLSCSGSSQVVTGLTPRMTYYVQVQAQNTVGGSTMGSGQDVEVSRIMAPTVPSGDQLNTVSFTSVPMGPDRGDLAFTLPTGGYWNKISIWKASAALTSDAQTAVLAAATTLANNFGPTGAPLAQITKTGSTPTTYADTNVTDGMPTCYLIRGVVDDGTYYQASVNSIVRCGQSNYTPPVFSGVATTGSAVVGTWPDGTAKIQIMFNGLPSGSIDEYQVFWANGPAIGGFALASTPWQSVTYGDATYDPDPNDSSIYVGGKGMTFSGPNYFVVRFKHYGGSDTDVNVAITNLVTVSTDQANFIQVPTGKSRLAYTYYMMAHEASLASGALDPSDNVTATEANLISCNYKFHYNNTVLDSSCGTVASTAKVQSMAGQTPLTANWHQAWMACRNSSNSVVQMRLPTELEWRRASTWSATDYSNQWGTYANTTPSVTNCNTTTGAVTNTGSHSACKSAIGVYDMAGNVSEWVDARLEKYDIAAAGESRFSYGPVIGRMINNGIDGLTRRYHNITPTNNRLALLLGSNYATTGFTYQKQYDAETESWQDPTVSGATRGFRCVVFPKKGVLATQAALAQLPEPIYTAANDMAGGTGATPAQLLTWKIPENLYVNDTKPESITHVLAPFPNTVNLAAWNIVDGSQQATTADSSGNGKNLTVSGTFAGGTRTDGTGWVMNAFDGTTSVLTSSDSMFDVTGAFTMGGWFYNANWATASGELMGRYKDSPINGGGYLLTMASTGIVAQAQMILTAPYVYLTGAGWHHIVWSRVSSTDNRLYVDGEMAASFATAMPINTGAYTFKVGRNFAGKVGALFFHAGIAYSDSDVKKRLAQNPTYFNVGALTTATAGKVTLNWTYWSKQVCVPSCSTVSNTANGYYVYRFIEPTKMDIRTTRPWAVSGGVNNPYASDTPLDPLATDSSGNLLCTAATTSCKLVATVTGANCQAAHPELCTFTDSPSAGTGFDSRMIYNYIMVVKDGDGNSIVPQQQHYRSPYFAGDPSATATSAFRTEPRFRRASVFLVDEAYQQTNPIQSNPQVMVHVPMDVSGLDHDFFIDKYEAASYSGSIVNETPVGSASWPLQAIDNHSGVWLSNPGQCWERRLRLGGFDLTGCGDGTQVNGTSTILQSAPGTTSINNLDIGAMWKACANTGITDVNGAIYYKSLTTDPEWNKASDWGDVNQDGTIDQSIYGSNISKSVAAMEYGTGDTTTVRCHTDNMPSAPYASNATATINCRSRFGVADMVGNMYEMTTGQTDWEVGVDNGVDGLWLGQTMPNIVSNTSLLTIGGGSAKYDLLRGFPKVSNGPVVSDNGDYFYTATGVRAPIRGGYFAASTAGRWTVPLIYLPSTTNSVVVGGRCSR